MRKTKTVYTTTRMILYEIKYGKIEVIGDSYGRIKGTKYKSLSELEKLINNEHHVEQLTREASRDRPKDL